MKDGKTAVVVNLDGYYTSQGKCSQNTTTYTAFSDRIVKFRISGGAAAAVEMIGDN
jgi:hypothetical protein